MSSHNIMDGLQEDNEQEMILRKTLAGLDVRRKSLEHEADAIYLELTTPPSEGVEPMGMDTPLVDPEGYPRGDVDVFRARTLRHRFRILQTDHKELSQEIESLLTQLAALKNPVKQTQNQAEQAARAAPKPKPKFDPVTGKWVVMNWDGTVAGVPGGDERQFHDLADNDNTAAASQLQAQVSGLTDSQTTTGTTSPSSSQNHQHQQNHQQHRNSLNVPRTSAVMTFDDSQKPFARIDAVAKGSPAEVAGLEEEDLILHFGYLNHQNHNHLKEIAQLVPECAAEQSQIPIRIKRRKRKLISEEKTKKDQHDEEEELLTIQLTPRPWNGRGLIGCHIVPYPAV